MAKKFKMGPIQKAWVESLLAHPERQMKDSLGEGTPRKYTACCLGEGLCVLARMAKKALPFNADGILYDFPSKLTIKNSENEGEWEDETSILVYSYDKLGLKDAEGRSINEDIIIGEKKYSTLASANDGLNVTWTDIGNYIKKHPENIFTKSL